MITALFDDQKKIILDWTPKAGCTILTKMFFRNMGLLEKALQFDSWIHEYRMHVFYKNHPITIEDFKNPDIYKIKVVRNPFHRVVSSYVHTMKYEFMHPPITKALWRWNANISFKGFINFLSKTDLHSCDPHYALQKKAFEYDIPNAFDEIIHLENLDAAINNLNKRKQLNFDLNGISSGHHVSRNDQLNRNVAGMRWSKIKDNLPDYKNFYTPQLAQKVYELYIDDFKTYGYTINDI